MDDKTKEDFIELFNQGFEEVVLPEIEGLREEMNQHFGKLETRVENIDRKLDRLSGQVAGHEQDLQKIKAIPAIAHELKPN